MTTRRSQDIMEIEELWSRVQARARQGWWRRRQGVQGVQVRRRRCAYKKVGYCQVHGKGARKVFEPSWVPSTSPGGTKTMEYQKKCVWRCNVVAMKTEQKLKQTKISCFMKTTSKETAGGTDTMKQMTTVVSAENKTLLRILRGR